MGAHGVAAASSSVFIISSSAFRTTCLPTVSEEMTYGNHDLQLNLNQVLMFSSHPPTHLSQKFPPPSFHIFFLQPPLTRTRVRPFRILVFFVSSREREREARGGRIEMGRGERHGEGDRVGAENREREPGGS